MALNPAVVKSIVTAATDKRVWKAILYIIVFSLGLIAAILMVFTSIISGIIGIFTDADVQQAWSYLTSRLSDVFNGLDTSINTDIKDTVYSFMPEFSVNLSKACINNNYDGSFLILYDTAEIEQADKYMAEAAEILRSSIDETEIELYLSEISDEINLSFSDIQNDVIFLSDSGISRLSEYDEKIRSAVFTIAQSRLNQYQYEYEEYGLNIIRC